MSCFDGQDLFVSGPHSFRLGPWQRCLQRRGFAGVSGELVLDLGLRSRQVFQTGRLQADTAAGLQSLLDAISDYCDGAEHVLVDNYDTSFPRVILQRFEPASAVKHGRGYYCDYDIEYVQLP